MIGKGKNGGEWKMEGYSKVQHLLHIFLLVGILYVYIARTSRKL
jgi:hypothetical protein